MHIGCTTTLSTYNIPYLLHEISPHFHDHNSRSLVRIVFMSKPASEQSGVWSTFWASSRYPANTTHTSWSCSPPLIFWCSGIFFYVKCFTNTSGILVTLTTRYRPKIATNIYHKILPKNIGKSWSNNLGNENINTGVSIVFKTKPELKCHTLSLFGY